MDWRILGPLIGAVIVLTITSLCAELVEWPPRLTPEAWAAWVQAIGATALVGTAVAIPPLQQRWAQRSNQRAALAAAEMVAANITGWIVVTEAPPAMRAHNATRVAGAIETAVEILGSVLERGNYSAHALVCYIHLRSTALSTMMYLGDPAIFDPKGLQLCQDQSRMLVERLADLFRLPRPVWD